MPKSLSLDLRQRMVDAYKDGEGTLETIADRFKASRSSLWRLLRQDQAEGNLEAKQRGGGKKPRVYRLRILSTKASWTSTGGALPGIKRVFL